MCSQCLTKLRTLQCLHHQLLLDFLDFLKNKLWWVLSRLALMGAFCTTIGVTQCASWTFGTIHFDFCGSASQ